MILGVIVGLRKLFGVREKPTCPITDNAEIRAAARELVQCAREQLSLTREVRDETRDLRGDLRLMALKLEHLEEKSGR